MGHRTSHPAGAFSWAELITSDADAAKAFYTSVFGWSYEDLAIGEDAVYTMAKRDGTTVAALMADEQPPHWNSYVTVASVEETAGKVAGLGGTLVAEPFDVMTAGRMAVLADPAGAVLCLWEAGESIGSELVNQPGALSWNDLLTPDAEAAAAFYGGLLGWTAEEIPDAGGYHVIRNGERSNGGIMPITPEMGPLPPAWLPYFGHDDTARLVGEAPGLGAQVLNGPVEMSHGTIATLADPQGAVFCVWSGVYDD